MLDGNLEIGAYVRIWLLVLGLGSVIFLGAYLKFRSGLGTRVFGTIIPIAAVAALVGHYIGSVGTTGRALLIGSTIGLVVVVPSILWLHNAVVTRLSEQVLRLTSSTAQIAATAQQAAATAAQQAASVAQISATVEELLQTSAATSAIAQQVASAASQASEQGAQGLDASMRAKAVLEVISQITEIVDSVREFAEQSNLLAVNAGIEAAKAGDQGRGFGVVAAEVRSLAEQSKRAAQRIGSAIGGAQEGRQAVEAANAALVQLSATLEQNADSAQRIAATAAQEVSGVQQISDAMGNVAEGGHANAVAAQQLESAVSTVKSVSEDLGQFVNG